MNWLWLAAYFFAGAFAGNSVPHFVSGVMGRAFQTPFAKPRGKGLSSSTVNVVWGFANMVAAYYLLNEVGQFDWHAPSHALAFGLGVLLAGLIAARQFGKYHGGDTPGS